MTNPTDKELREAAERVQRLIDETSMEFADLDDLMSIWNHLPILVAHALHPATAQQKAVAERLFKHIEHGDAEHRAWLKKELDAFFAKEAAAQQEAIVEVLSVRRTEANRTISVKFVRAPGWQPAPNEEVLSREPLLYVAAPPAAPGVPEGWKLVPVEPTEEMAHEGAIARMHTRDVRFIWKRMLHASPIAPGVKA